MTDQILFDDLLKITILTKREKELLTLANEGLGNNIITDKLSISPGTVKKHFDNIYRKLDASKKYRL